MDIFAGDMRSSIVMLENVIILAHKGWDFWTQYLIVVSDTIQVTNNGMKSNVMAVGYSRPNHYISAVVCHSVYNGDISILIPCTAPHMRPPICSVKLEIYLVTEVDMDIPSSC